MIWDLKGYPLTPRGDLRVISSCNLHTLTRKLVMIILKLIRLKLYFDLTPNSHNQFTRKCVAARGGNLGLDLGS